MINVSIQQERFNTLCLLLLACLLVTSCRNNKGKKENQTLFTLVDSSGIRFQNTVVDNKKDNSFYFRNFYNGGGVAIGDINNDGLADVMLTSNMGENKLYLNKGNFRFEDITANSGMKQDSMWSTGVVMADVNDDGWLDIYVCNSGHINDGNRRNKLYINNGRLGFTEMSKAYGLDHSGYCTQASFFDYDQDGDLDCLIINNSPLPFSSLNYADMRDVDIAKWNINDNLKGGGNHLYRNDAVPGSNQRYFTEVTREAGLHTGLISFGLGVSVGDINGDNYPDIYVGNDFIERDYLYINQHDGTFKDQLEDYVQQISMSSMSTDLGDINNDGNPEIFTTDMIPDNDYRLKTTGTFDNIDLYLSKQRAGLYQQYVKNCLQLNNGNGTFSEIGNYTGVSGTDWSWGALFFDADNDGLNDIYVCNGINKDLGDLDFLDYFSNDIYRKMLETGKRDELDEILKHIPSTPLPNRVFRNDGQLHFTDIGKQWGLAQPSFSNSAAYGDLDNDGDLDLVVNNENQPAFVYRNGSREQTGNHYVSVQLRGLAGNGFAIGSKIKVYGGGQVFYRELVPSRGFQSSVDYKQVIGLGALTQVDSVVVTWPNGTSSRYDVPRVDQVYAWSQPAQGTRSVSGPVMAGATWLEAVASNMEAHREDNYVDFYYERNLPEQLSTEGPRIARGDVNGDGLEDIYIGGAKDQEGQLYVQTAIGWVRKEQAVFGEYRDFEDVAVLFFDADRDGDLDLFVGAGGNAARPGSRELQHRLYVNDGKGNFSLDVRAFPNNDMNIAVAAAQDYDGDGDMDLFVGSRSVPGNYGLTPVSYLYNNDGSGHFKEVTREVAPGLLNVGMVTGAVWADVLGDGNGQLVVTGEWMYPRVFGYDKGSGKLQERKGTGLEQSYGWWQTVAAGDVNGDGKVDLVLGNVGENFYLRPDRDHPVKLWLNDFDGNGTTEQFLTRTVEGKDMPVFLKREVTDQFPGLKKQNLKHSDYAVKSVQELFGEGVMSKSVEKRFTECRSLVALNKGGGRFELSALPSMVQLSSVNAVELVDVSGDGKVDLVLGGNMFSFPPQFGRLDGSYGQVLLQTEKGGWQWQSPLQSGLSTKGQIRDIKTIRMKNKEYLLFARNNERPAMFLLKTSETKKIK